MPQQGQPVIVDYNHTVSTNNATISYVNFLVDPSAKAINVDTLITGSNDNIIIFEAVCVSTPVATKLISEKSTPLSGIESVPAWVAGSMAICSVAMTPPTIAGGMPARL